MRRIRCAYWAVLCAALLVVSSCGEKTESFTFIQITDPQIGFNDGAEELTVGRFARIVDKIIEIHPDFVICTGDMTDSMFQDEWQFQSLDSLLQLIPDEIPVYFTPGNHDYRVEWPGSREFYEEHYGPRRFSFTHKGSFFLGYDSNAVAENVDGEEQKQFDWIASELETNGKGAKHIFVFQHCPVYRISIDEEKTYFNFEDSLRTKYMDMFAKYGVDAVFSGHQHCQAVAEYEGVKMINCAPCGLALGEKDGMGQVNRTGFNLISVEPDSFSCETITME